MAEFFGDTLKDDFFDVDFRDYPEYTFGDLGVAHFASDTPTFEDTVELIDESRWDDLIKDIDDRGGNTELLIRQILNQKNEGSCVGFASTQANMIVQAKQFGKDNAIDMSGISLYKQIGRSPNSGSMVSDAIDAMLNVGSLPLDTPKNRELFGNHVMPATGFYTPWPDGWKSTAKKFKAHEWTLVRSVKGMFTALFMGYPVVVGRQGHSICYVRPTKKNGQYCVIYANSWSPDWGFGLGGLSGGFGLDSYSQVKMSSSWAFALRSVVVR